MILFLQSADILEDVQRWEKRAKTLGCSEVLGTAFYWGALGREVVEGEETPGLGQAG